MKIAGLLAEKGVWGLAVKAHPPGALRVWVLLAQDSQIEVWGRDVQGFSLIATASAEDGGEKIAANFSDWLLSALEQNVLDRIILVAAPPVLRTIHDAFPTDIIACIAAEIPRDLSQMSYEERKDNIEKMVFI